VRLVFETMKFSTPFLRDSARARVGALFNYFIPSHSFDACWAHLESLKLSETHRKQSLLTTQQTKPLARLKLVMQV
jgi:hypothetical protein